MEIRYKYNKIDRSEFLEEMINKKILAMRSLRSDHKITKMVWSFSKDHNDFVVSVEFSGHFVKETGNDVYQLANNLIKRIKNIESQEKMRYAS